MSVQGNLIAYGQYTSDGASQTLEIPSGVSYIVVEDRTSWGQKPNAVVRSWWQKGMATGYANQISEAAATGVLSAVALTSLGFEEIGTPTIGAEVAITAITNAAPAVASTATTPSVGDIVRVYDTTTMLQAAGIDYSITAVNPGVTMTLGYLDASGFAAAATAGNYRKLSPYELKFYPKKRTITKITQAASAVITLSVVHGYVVGQKVKVWVPEGYGMTEINGQIGEITAISTVNNTITVNIDSTGYTAFAYPTSANSFLYSKPEITPAGEITTILSGAVSNESLSGMYLGSGVVGTSGHVMQWRAYKGVDLS